MATLFNPRYQAMDANGLPYSGALLYFYIAETSTLITVYQDFDATTPHTNPVVADAAGVFPPIYLPPTAVKVNLKTAGGVTLQTIDRIQSDAVTTLTAGDGIYVDDTNPAAPEISVLPFVGDTGTGGEIGAVPAPAAGDAAANKVLGAGGGWVDLSFVPRGQYYGLTLSNNVMDATNDIDIAAGEAASNDIPPILMEYAGATGVQLDVAYGTGSGGRFDSSISDGTWYVFIISNGTTVSRGLSKSLNPTSQPNYPGAYIHYRRIGSVIRKSGAILPFTHSGITWLLTSPVSSVGLNNPSVTAVLAAMEVPDGIQVTVIADVYLQSAETIRRALLITSPDQADVSPTPGTASTFAAGTTVVQGSASGRIQQRTNSSRQIRYRMDGASANTSLFITTVGWIDEV